MKYVVITRVIGETRQEFPFIFPEDIYHADMEKAAQTLVQALIGRGNGAVGPTVAAGTVIFDSAPRCYGESTGLHIVSRRDVDGQLLLNYEMTNGKPTSPRNG